MATGRKDYSHLRNQMVRKQLERRGIKDQRVLDAMAGIPREDFVDESLRSRAYDDNPLPIGDEQTISQPYIVASMAEALELKPHQRILEVGTGCGYNAAVLSQLAGEVYTMEIIEPLAVKAQNRLENMGLSNIFCRQGDAYQGWPEKAPFAGIVLTAAAPEIPQPLIDQLAEGGKLIAPVGKDLQKLILLSKKSGKIHRKELFAVSFVPMTGATGL